MNRSTLETIINHADNSASTDVSRYHMTHVVVRRIDRSKLRIVSTNGHILAESLCVDGDSENIADLKAKDDQVYFDTANLKLLKLCLKEFKPIQDFPTFIESGVLKFKIGSTTFSFENNVNYPDIDRLYPTGEKVAEIHLNPRLLLDLFNSLKNDKMQSGLTLTVFKGRKPIAVNLLGDTSQFGLIMPMKAPENKEILI